MLVVEVGAAAVHAAPRTSAPTCNAAEQRMKKPTIVVNCLAFPHELTGAELELELGKKIINENHPLCASIKLSSP